MWHLSWYVSKTVLKTVLKTVYLVSMFNHDILADANSALLVLSKITLSDVFVVFILHIDTALLR